jgi:tRNA(fMet)-specific endonuclease VapC
MRLNVGVKDLRIAAITLEHGGILVTRNVSDFQRIPNLTIANWAV